MSKSKTLGLTANVVPLKSRRILQNVATNDPQLRRKYLFWIVLFLLFFTTTKYKTCLFLFLDILLLYMWHCPLVHTIWQTSLRVHTVSLYSQPQKCQSFVNCYSQYFQCSNIFYILICTIKICPEFWIQQQKKRLSCLLH